MDHIKVIDTQCPYCGHILDSSLNSTDETSRPPKPNDPSVCMTCAGVAVFDDDMNLVKPTGEQIRDWARNPELQLNINKARELVRQMIAEKARNKIQPKTLAQMWEFYDSKTTPKDAGPDQRFDLQNAFYAGVFSVLTELMGPVADLSEEDGQKQLAAYSHEATKFITVMLVQKLSRN